MEMTQAYLKKDRKVTGKRTVGIDTMTPTNSYSDPGLIRRIETKAEFAKDRADFFKVMSVVFGIMLVISNVLWITTEQHLPVGLFPLPFFGFVFIAYLLKMRSYRAYKASAEKERRDMEKANLGVQQARRPIPSIEFGIRLEGQRSYETYEEATIRIDKEHRRVNLMVMIGLILVGLTTFAGMAIKIFKEVM